MNVIDENVIDNQRQQLLSWRIQVRQIGHELGNKGIKDGEIIPLRHHLNRPTFFTRDDDFYERKLCHTGYSLVLLDVRKGEVATFIRRVLRHPKFNTKAKRMGKVIRASHVGLSFWEINREEENRVSWNN